MTHHLQMQKFDMKSMQQKSNEAKKLDILIEVGPRRSDFVEESES